MSEEQLARRQATKEQRAKDKAERQLKEAEVAKQVLLKYSYDIVQLSRVLRVEQLACRHVHSLQQPCSVPEACFTIAHSGLQHSAHAAQQCVYLHYLMFLCVLLCSHLRLCCMAALVCNIQREAVDAAHKNKAQKRLRYLLAQSDIFKTHFGVGQVSVWCSHLQYRSMCISIAEPATV
jgi:hypothetical protein